MGSCLCKILFIVPALQHDMASVQNLYSIIAATFLAPLNDCLTDLKWLTD